MKLNYPTRRLLLLLPTLLGLSFLVFGITRLVPGGPIERALASAQGGGEGRGSAPSVMNLTDDDIAQLKEFYGLDKPFLASYADWIGKVFRLDLGYSFSYQEPVADVIRQRLPVTLGYGAVCLLLLYALAIPLGYLKAIHHRSVFDTLSSFFLFLFQSVPGFVIGLFLIMVFAVKWDLFPMTGFKSEDFAALGPLGKLKDLAWHGTLPVIAYLMGLLAFLAILTKNALLENMSAEYMRTAVAKGMSFQQAVRSHAFRNSLVALVPYIGSSIGLLVGGSFLIETIFTIEGIGLLGYEALMQRDYPLVMGILLLTALVMLLGNILADVLIVLVDPRVHLD